MRIDLPKGTYRAFFDYAGLHCDGILEVVSGSIFLYTNEEALNGARSDAFRKDSKGFIYCYYAGSVNDNRIKSFYLRERTTLLGVL